MAKFLDGMQTHATAVVRLGMNFVDSVGNILTKQSEVGVEIVFDMTWSASVYHWSEVWIDITVVFVHEVLNKVHKTYCQWI